MTDLVPSDDRISRDALDRIIRRAAELQAGEREFGDTLTERDVLDLGRDVGLPGRYVQQALLEERNRVAPGRGMLDRVMGPLRVTTSRTVPGDARKLERLLDRWMTDEETLVVKRRYPTKTSWEPQKGLGATLRRAVGGGGRKYVLAGTREILGEVTSLEDGWCHMSLTADLRPSRKERLTGAGFLATSGVVSTVVAAALGIMMPVAVIPVAIGAGAGILTLRSQRRVVEEVHVALAQILDKFEHGEIGPKALPPPPGGGLARAIRDELRKHLGP